MQSRSHMRVISNDTTTGPGRFPKAAPRKEDVQSLSLVLARKVALACYPRRIGAMTLYDVPRGWVSAVLRDDPHISVPETSFDLNDCFNRRDVDTILIPYDFTTSRAVVEKMCGFCGLAKTVFFEVENE